MPAQGNLNSHARSDYHIFKVLPFTSFEERTSCFEFVRINGGKCAHVAADALACQIGFALIPSFDLANEEGFTNQWSPQLDSSTAICQHCLDCFNQICSTHVYNLCWSI